MGHYEKNIVYFFTRDAISRFPTLRSYKQELRSRAQSLASVTNRIISNEKENLSRLFNLLASMTEFISAADFPVFRNTSKRNLSNNPAEIVLPAPLRKEIAFPPRIVADVVFNNLIITLRSEDDIVELERTVRRYLFDCLYQTVWQLYIGNRAAELMESGAKDIKVIKETNLYRELKKCRVRGPRGSGTILFTANKILSAIVERILPRTGEQTGARFSGFQALRLCLPDQVLYLPAVNLNLWYASLRKWTFFIGRVPGSAVSSVLRGTTFCMKKIRSAAEMIYRRGRSFVGLCSRIFLSLLTSLAGRLRRVFSLLPHTAKRIRRLSAYLRASIRWKAVFQFCLIPVLLLVIIGETAPVFPSAEEQTSSPSISLDATVNLEKVIDKSVAAISNSFASDETGRDYFVSYQENDPFIAGIGIYYFEDSAVNFHNKLHFTFDDGPNLNYIDKVTITEEILDILKPLHIRATFFINGKNLVDADETPLPLAKKIITRIIEEGHLIANHSYSHHNLANGSYNDGINDLEEIKEEIRRTQSALDKLLGRHYPMRYFRPPYAEAGRNEKVDRAVRELNMEMIIFQIDSYDYRMQSEYSLDEVTILTRMKQSIEESTGGVVLLHDKAKTAELLPDILYACKTIKNEAGTFTQSTLQEMLRMKYHLAKGF